MTVLTRYRLSSSGGGARCLRSSQAQQPRRFSTTGRQGFWSSWPLVLPLVLIAVVAAHAVPKAGRIHAEMEAHYAE